MSKTVTAPESAETDTRAADNARAWLASIHEGMTALAALQGGDAESVTYERETFADEDELRQRIEQGPLSVQVRGGWYSPGDPDKGGDPEEFEILLSTGGPALRITGDIGGTPCLQYQDWGTPWTDYRGGTPEEAESLAAYVALFWFGE